MQINLFLTFAIYNKNIIDPNPILTLSPNLLTLIFLKKMFDFIVAKN